MRRPAGARRLKVSRPVTPVQEEARPGLQVAGQESAPGRLPGPPVEDAGQRRAFRRGSQPGHQGRLAEDQGADGSQVPGREAEGHIAAKRRRHQVSRAQAQGGDQPGEVLGVQQRRVFGPAFVEIIGVMVAPAVGDDAVVLGEPFHLQAPGTQVIHAAVDEDQRLAMPLLEVCQAGAVGSDCLDAACHAGLSLFDAETGASAGQMARRRQIPWAKSRTAASRSRAIANTSSQTARWSGSAAWPLSSW